MLTVFIKRVYLCVYTFNPTTESCCLHPDCVHWFRKKCCSLIAHHHFNVCVCLFASFFCFSDDFYFHLALIERKIMHTFISFWFQSHTFREDERKTDYCAFFIGCFMLWKTHFMYTCVCARVKFSSITAAAADVAVYISLPHSFCVK